MENRAGFSITLNLEISRINRQGQIRRLIGLGYHKARQMSEEEYSKFMPEFKPQTKQLKRFSIPLLVDPLDLKTQLELMGVENDLADSGSETIVNATGVTIPETPYQIWAQDGFTYLSQSANDLLKLLPPDERGLTLMEGLALFRERPELRRMPNYYSISLYGSRDGNGQIPQILHWTYKDNPAMNYMPKDPSAGEEECWCHGTELINRTGGWPTCAA